MAKTKKQISSPETTRYSDIQVPCDVGDPAYIPYWNKSGSKIVYGIDEYVVKAICGCGDSWACRIADKNGVLISSLEPNVDVFFTKKEAQKKLSVIQKTEDPKKLAKWKRNSK